MSAGRRGNGEGTIVKRADGRWAAAIIFDGYRRKWICGKTRRDVSDRLRKVRSDVAEGRLSWTGPGLPGVACVSPP